MKRPKKEKAERDAQLGLFGTQPTPPLSPDLAPGPKPKKKTHDEIAQEVLDHLNTITERTGPARFTSPKSVKERLREGASVEHLLLVADFCHAMWWGDTKMEIYIRPKTLFGKENFPDYLVRARKWVAAGRPSLSAGKASGENQGGYARGAEYYARMTEEGDS